MTGPFNFQVPKSAENPVKRRYSLTTDIVAFRRCSRQYGAFRVYNYAPAHQTQLYFGQIIHQVLDRCHTHYLGLIDASTKGNFPDNCIPIADEVIQEYFEELKEAETKDTKVPDAPGDIVRYFIEVENGLKSRGIRAITSDLRLKAVRVLQYFNALEGPELYPRVQDTEHRLQADRGDHIVQGVVDLLVNPETESNQYSDCEIWDYKGVDPLNLKPRDIETYRFQMQVYSRLYEWKHGVRPKRAILYFINELDGDRPPQQRPVNAIMEVPLNTPEIDEAMEAFARTVEDIELARLQDYFPPAKPGAISDQDCNICDLRWNCPTPKKIKMRYP